MIQPLNFEPCTTCTRQDCEVEGRDERFVRAGIALAIDDKEAHGALVDSDTDRAERADNFSRMSAELACGFIIGVDECPLRRYDCTTDEIVPKVDV